MAMVVSQVRLDEEDLQDIRFWLERPAAERIGEVTRLRKAYYSWKLGSYPEHMEKVVNHRKHDI